MLQATKSEKQEYQQLQFCQVETLVSRTASQALKEKELPTLVTYGLNTLESYKKQTPVGLLTKMLLEAYPTELCLKRLLTWKVSAMSAKHLLFLLLPLVRGIYGSEYLSLPTPTASDYRGGRTPRASEKAGRTDRNNLRGFIRHIHATPTASQNHKKIRKLTPSEKNGTHGKILPGSLGEQYPETIGRYPNPQYLEWMMGFPIGWSEARQ